MSAGPAPLSKQRSEWRPFAGPPVPAAARCSWHERNVHDGVLAACAAIEPLGPDGALEWHLSISHRDHRGQFRRYPTWDEIADARYQLLPPDLTFVMYLPPAEEYVAVHPTTFHLHQDPRSA